MEKNKADWNALFEPYPFFEAYKNYLQIDISAENDDDLRKWKGWVESRLRQLTLKIERHTFGMLQCHPHPGDFSDKSRPFHCSYFMGLSRKQGVSVHEGKQFDIRATVEEFKLSVGMYTLWKPRMEIHVSHIKRRNIPLFVFPGGIRPSRPAKEDGESKPVSNLKLCNSVQASKSCESAVGAMGVADDIRKRKLGYDNDENNPRAAKLLSVTTTEGSVSRSSPTASTCTTATFYDAPSEVRERGQHENNLGDSPISATCLTGVPSHGGEAEGSVRCSPLVKPSSTNSDLVCSKEAEKLAIEKIASGPSVSQQGFLEELDELEDDIGSTDQVKVFGVSRKGISSESLAENVRAAAVNGICSPAGFIQNGGLEELEVEPDICGDNYQKKHMKLRHVAG
nr:TPA_asm: hypothetical protein HUJ06_000448 [Nelumbo nucifera]